MEKEEIYHDRYSIAHFMEYDLRDICMEKQHEDEEH